MNISQIEVVWRIGKLKPLLEARSHCHPYALTVTLIGLKCQLQSVHSVRGRNCLFHQVLKLEGPTDGCWTKEDCQEPSLNSRVSELNILQITKMPKISQVFTKKTHLCKARRLSSLMPTAKRSGAPAMQQFISISQRSWERQTYDEHMTN